MEIFGGIIKQLRAKDPKVVITLNPEQSAIRSLRGNIATPGSLAALHEAPFEQARQFIREHKSIFGGIDEAKDSIEKRSITNRRDMTHVIFQQAWGCTGVGRNAHTSLWIQW
jgi:hypothetical protein